MSNNTTAMRRLADQRPKSETQFHRIQAEGHKIRGKAGDAAWAKFHEQAIEDIRAGAQEGSTLALCPKCLEQGRRVVTIMVGEAHKCGSCDWTDQIS